MTRGSPTPTANAEPNGNAPLLLGIVLSVTAWTLCFFLLTSTLPEFRNPFSLSTVDWAHWDSWNYLKIAVEGRDFGRCGEPGFPFSPLYPSPHRVWCGTAGWLPGYPWLTKAVAALGLPIPASALLVSRCCELGALLLIWWGWLRTTKPAKALLILLLFGTFPGAVYNFSVFPTSSATLFLLLALVSAQTERLALTALFMVIAGLIYPSIWFATFGLSFALWLGDLHEGPSLAARRGLWGGMGILSLAVLGILDWSSFRHPDAYFAVQLNQDTRETSVPGLMFLRLLINHDAVVQRPLGLDGARLLALQTALAAGVVTAAFLMMCLRTLRRSAVPLGDLCAAACSFAIVAGLILHGNVGAWNRSVVIAAPCIVCLRRLPSAVLVALLVCLAVVTALMSRYYFNDLLV